MDLPLSRLNLSSAKLWDLPDQERYVFALAGHVFNELMFLQKLMIAAVPDKGAHTFSKDASVGSSMFTLRMVVSKAHEAMQELRKESNRSIFLDRILSKRDGLRDQWELVVRRYESLPWLGSIRNQGGFHYLSHKQWSLHIDQALCQDGYVIVGKTYGTTYFHWNEVVASWPIMKKVNADNPFEGLGLAIDELGALLGEMGECLALGLQAYICEVLMDESSLESEQSVSAHALGDVHFNYFFSGVDPI
jgi:hypothetical protein